MLAGTQPQPSRAVANDVGDGLDEVVADVLEHRAARCPADQPRAAPDEHGAVSVDEDPERFAPRPARRASDRLRTPSGTAARPGRAARPALPPPRPARPAAERLPPPTGAAAPPARAGLCGGAVPGPGKGGARK